MKNYKTNQLESIAFSYNNNNIHKEGVYGHIPISKRLRENIIIKVTKEMKGLYNKNFKSLNKDLEKDQRKQTDTACSWIRKITLWK